MFQTVKNNTITFITSLDAVNGAYEKAKADLVAKYTGVTLSDKLGELQAGHLEARKELREQYLTSIPTEFEAIRGKITDIAMRPIPADVAATLESAEGLELTDAEREALLKLASSNYLATRKVRTLFKINAPKEYDNALAITDDLESLVIKTLTSAENGKTDSYDALNLKSGYPFDVAEETAGELTNTYRDQTGGGE